ncbi:aminopeptidase P family protein [Sediminivirga luteola]|uniref:Xaa-Pro aminopeptidase n=1 Tax=Sediminivirga luteola TaxID=1774748 RepID=A0A8J2XJQ3_9MICO|nr:aminopeptidase P family protein [Sediminivirga luteola]MCI2265689.1 aminopeptidase P family protein [Sediminivirga luteola]GGA07410.1 Xaa-Pro aminopeptidase [Sediminivirga luteola]
MHADQTPVPESPSPRSAGHEAGAAPADAGSQRSHRPRSKAFREFIASGWAETAPPERPLREVAPYAAERRRRISALFPGERLVLPAGGLKVRSNDTDYRFRPHSAFAHLSGMQQDEEPDAVLVLEPEENGPDGGHRAILYFRPRAGADTEEFFADSRYGEFWVGRRPELAELAAELGFETRHISQAADEITKDLASTQLRLVRQADPVYDELIAQARQQQGIDVEQATAADDALAQALSELRLVKDEYEIARIRDAVAITRRGFEEVVSSLPSAVAHHRGERVVETAFELAARQDGNGVGYDTIAASGDHACTLHWIVNDGAVRPGELILVDAGAEHDSLYTADITRTLPVSGRFTPRQREIYQAVLDAADAAFSVAGEHHRRPVLFRDVHEAAMRVIAERLESWGLLPVSAQEALSPQGQQHRRWMVHGTSHHLGLDVHDCALARAQMYLDAELEPGMVFTIEPGLYFKSDDLLVPEDFRGTGVRIEDDVLVTEDGVENLSAAFPRTVEQIEAWLKP